MNVVPHPTTQELARRMVLAAHKESGADAVLLLLGHCSQWQIGALIGLLLDMAAGRRKVPDLPPPPPPEPLEVSGPRAEFVAAVVHAVSDATGVSAHEIVGRNGHKATSRARAVAYVAVRESGFSLHEAGRAFGRDHSTIRHAVVRVERDPELAALVAEVKARLATNAAYSESEAS